MKKYISIFVISGILIGFSLTGCSDNLLNIEQNGVIDPDKTYTEANDATAQQLIAQVYTQVKYLTTGDWGINYFLTLTVKTGETWPGGSDPNDGSQYQQIAAMKDDSENSVYQDIYSRLYKIMYECNLIVEKLNSESTERKRVISEAKAWRAWAMMRLTQLWGSAPLVSHTLNGTDYSFYPSNTDPEKSWAWIMQQFDEAAEVLPSKSGLGGQKAIGGRWTKEACYAFKGEGYMWQNDYENAKIWLGKVISSGKYQLWTKTTTLGDYGTNLSNLKEKNKSTWIDGSKDYRYLTLFRADADFCDEYILELDIDGDATTITNVEPGWFWMYVGWRQDQLYMTANTLVGDGWGFANPTKNFGLSFVKHDGNSIRRRMSIATFDEVYYDFPYVTSQNRGIMEGKKLYDNQGYFRMKYFYHLDDQQPARYAAGNAYGDMMNFPLMRYSNILLFYAEAVCESGSEGKAGITGLEALNLVRTRAGLDPAPTLDMNNETYGIKAERRFELYLEDCDRYVDLIRWGDYKNFMTDTSEKGVGDYWGEYCCWLHGFIDSSKGNINDPTDLSNYNITYDKLRTKSGWDDKFLLFPFPYAEINANKNLKQNSGW